MSDFGKPSAFTPFLRRFTDERARDLRDTEELYERVRRLHRASSYSEEDAQAEFGTAVYAECQPLSEPLQAAFIQAIDAVIRYEKPIFEFPKVDLATAHLSLQESVDLRRFLRAKDISTPMSAKSSISSATGWRTYSAISRNFCLKRSAHHPSPSLSYFRCLSRRKFSMA